MPFRGGSPRISEITQQRLREERERREEKRRRERERRREQQERRQRKRRREEAERRQKRSEAREKAAKRSQRQERRLKQRREGAEQRRRVRRRKPSERPAAKELTETSLPKTLQRGLRERQREERKAKQLTGLLRKPQGERRQPRKPAVKPARERSESEREAAREEALRRDVEEGVIRPAQEDPETRVLPEGPTTGQQIYEGLAKAGMLAGSVGVPAINTLKAAALAARGVRAGGVKVGGSKVLGPALRPKEVGGKSAAKAARKRRAARETSRRSEGRVKRAGKAVFRTERRRDKALARQLTGTRTGRQTFAQAPLPAKLAQAGAAQTPPVVRGHERAITQSPKTTAQTTARVIPGLITAPVGIATGAAISGGRAASAAAEQAGIPGARGYTSEEIGAPIGGELEAQMDFARQVARTVTSDDPSEVQETVEQDLGAILPVMAALGAYGLSGRGTRGRVSDSVRKVAEDARRKVGREHGQFRGAQPRVFERTGQRKTSAKTVAKGRLRTQREQAARGREVLGEGQKARGGRTTVREGVVRKGPLRRKANLEVRDGDVVSFLQANAMRLDDPQAMMKEVRRIEDSLDPIPEGMQLDPAVLRTRDVIEHIKRNPDVLRNPNIIGAVRQYRKQERYARSTPGLSPEHSPAARFMPAAVTRRKPLPENMFPKEVRGEVRAAPRYGVPAKEVLRKEARRDRSRARKQRRQAAKAEGRAQALRRELEVRQGFNRESLDLPPTKSQLAEIRAIREMDKRGAFGKGPVGPELRVAGGTRAPRGKAPPARHGQLMDRIDKLDTEAVELRRKAEGAEEMAKRKAQAAKRFNRSIPELADEFVENMKNTLRGEGIPDADFPEWAHRGIGGSPREVPAFGGATLPGKSKRRKGTAEQFGIVEEGLAPLIRESINRPVARRETYKAMREILEDNRFEAGNKRKWGSKEADELFQGPDRVLNPENWVKVDTNLTKRIYDVLEGRRKGEPIDTSDVSLLADLQTALKEQPTGPQRGRQYEIVRRAAMEEGLAQLGAKNVSATLSRLNRASSYLILATSPAWAALQVLAEGGQAAAAQPKLLNPAFLRKATKEYKAMPPHKRQALDSWVGVTNRTIERKEDMKLDLQRGDMKAAGDAYSVMNATPYGKFLKGLPQSIRRFDLWKGGRIRAMVVAAKADKELRRPTAEFVGGVRGMHEEMGKALADLKGQPLQRQLSYIAENPAWARRFEGYLDDVMGNWTALTKNERIASQVAIFYPFLRMSFRWTFLTYPKRHPIKAAMLYYLGQQNAEELTKLTQGDPSYFQQFGMQQLDLGESKVVADFGRIAPGANALSEALAGGVEGPLPFAAMKATHPVISALGTAIFGTGSFTAEQEPHSGWRALAQLLPNTLSAPGRFATEALTPEGRKPAEGASEALAPFGKTEKQGPLDAFFAKMRQEGTPARATRILAAPWLPQEADRVTDAAKMGRILDTLQENDSSARKELAAKHAQGSAEDRRKARVRITEMKRLHDEAEAEKNALFDKWGIPWRAEDKRFDEGFGEILGGEESSSGGPLRRRLESGSTSASPLRDRLESGSGVGDSPLRERLER